MSRVIKPTQMMEVDRCYPVETVERLATRHFWPKGERHLVLTVLKGSRKEIYVLPLMIFYAK